MCFAPLNQKQIQKYCQKDKEQLVIQLPDSIASTNDMAKEEFLNTPEKFSVVATNKQTAGRGRQGRIFYSDLSHGLYFSLAFTPNTKKMEEIPLYTLLAAAALVEVLAQEISEPLSVKWVNDIFYNGRKISGILSELVSAKDQPGVVVGVGVNFSGNFNEACPETQSVAGTLFGEKTPKSFNQNAFLGTYLARFYDYHRNFQAKEFMPVYENHLLGLGKKVSYQMNNELQTGVIQGINEKGHLLVKKPDQTIEALYGQEIHLGSEQFSGKE